MKEILEKIYLELKAQTDEIRFQRNLLEDMYHAKDEKQFNSAHMNKSMAMLIKNLNTMPAMQNPQAQEMVKNLMGLIPGGKS